VTLDKRGARTLVLVVWSGFLAWMWVSGETVRYLGPRTAWLVPFGALALGLAAAIWIRSPRVEHEPPRRLTLAEAAGFGALLLPVAAALLLSGTQLGAMAASKKLTARGIDPSALAELASRNAAQVGFVQIQVAEHNPKFAGESGIHPGSTVRLLGFVSKGPSSKGAPFELSRFYITCCVADSVPMGVTIEPADRHAPAYERDDWLSISGQLVRRGPHLVLRGTRIASAEAPKDPYLTFTP
jgi:putative membrane protein